jgi:glucosylceramidase
VTGSLAAALLAAGLAAASAGTVQVWLTTGDRTALLAPQPDIPMAATRYEAELHVDVDEAALFQEIDGFGASVTDPAIWTALKGPVRDEAMRLLFDREAGIALSYLRVPVGNLGLDDNPPTYDDMPKGKSDPGLDRFSIKGDLKWKIPLIKEAKRLNPELHLIASPWSPPAWMKTGENLGKGRLKPECYAVYSRYLVRFLQAYAAEGLVFDTITPQNEPWYEPGWYLGMRMDPAEEAAFVKVLGPALRAARLSTRILVWDHNWDHPEYPIAVLDDSAAREWIAGTAFHGYGGDVAAMSQVRLAHPDKDLYFTEVTSGDWSTKWNENLKYMTAVWLVGSLRNWARSVLFWPLARQTTRGDRGVVTVRSDGSGVDRNVEYAILGHASKFLRSGARRIGSQTYGAGSIMDVAFRNPNGSKVLVALTWGGRKTFAVRDRDRSFVYDLPAESVATFVWR